MQNIVSIQNITIRQTANNLYSLNDLHKASGGEDKHAPRRWLQNQQTDELIAELSKDGNSSLDKNQQVIQVIKGGNNSGTFVCKELVIHYAMWISAKFSLQVIQTFLNVHYPETISAAQKQQIQAAVNRRVHRTGETHQAIYTAIHELAQVASYHDIAAADFERVMAFLENALSEKQPEQPQIPNYDYGMARLFVKYGAGVAQVSDLNMALHQLSHIQGTFLKMLEHKALHFKLNDAEQKCLTILANWQMAVANVGCKL